MPDQQKPAEGAPSALPVSAAQIEHAAALLDAGGLVAFPTETVYGLGGDASCTWRRRAIRITGSSICLLKRSV
jgi:tRNA A37 threonylcarbamoyladenosine synthetase subunit TsaC/SUA5/YrdC